MEVKHRRVPKNSSLIERLKFYSQVVESGCQEWNGTMAGNGYGQLHWGGKMRSAYVLSWEFHNNQIRPAKMVICHKCDNKKCINIDHLFLGTYADNTNDMYNKNRHFDLKGANHPLVKLTEDEVLSIRSDSRRLKTIAAEFGIHPTYVGQIKKRRVWRHV